MLTGKGQFIDDKPEEGALWLYVLRSPHAHARVLRVDVAKAERMPGVLAVLHDGCPGAQIAWHPGRDGKPLSRLFDPHCRHEGEEVAAVAAETPYQAWDAVRAIAVDYEVLPAVVDAAAGTVVASVPVGTSPMGVVVNPEGTRAYVANAASGTVSVIDTATDAVIATVPVGAGPYGLAVTPTGKYVYVANSNSDTVSVIETAAHTVIATLPVGISPFALGLFIGGERC